MKRQAGTLAVFAAALSGTLPILLEANVILFSLTLASIVVLLLSALILVFHNRFSSRIWKWLVDRANSIEIEYAAAGLGLCSTGLSLFQPGWIYLGIAILLLGAFLIGSQIRKVINMTIHSRKVKQI